MKKTRSMWARIAATNRSAAQWWICRMQQAAADVEADVQRRGVGLAHVDAVQVVGTSRGRRSSVMLGWKNNVRNVPVSSKMMNEYRAISPSRNDQWSGKTFRSRYADALGPGEPVVQPAADALEPALDAHDRSQKLGPTASWKSLCATRNPCASVVIGSCGSGRVGRPEQDLGAARRVERGLVARAQDVVRGLLVQGGRAAHVRADLGVGDDVVRPSSSSPSAAGAGRAPT